MSREEGNLSDRNINPRDSGIAGSFLHDNTINESSSSEEEEVIQPNLQVITEEKQNYRIQTIILTNQTRILKWLRNSL